MYYKANFKILLGQVYSSSCYKDSLTPLLRYGPFEVSTECFKAFLKGLLKAFLKNSQLLLGVTQMHLSSA